MLGERTDTPHEDVEFALAAACALASDDELAAATGTVDAALIDWPRFVALVRYHLIASLALTRIRACSPGLLPPEVETALRRDHVEDAAMHTVHLRETIAVLAVLQQAAVEALVLKGVAVACMLYAEAPECRTASDIDVIIPEAALERADAQLTANGYERLDPREWPTPSARPMFFHLENVITYRSPAHGQVIELHIRLSGNPYVLSGDFDAMKRSSTPVVTRQGSFRGIGDSRLAEYLAWHAATAIDCRLKWFADVSRALERAGAREGCVAQLHSNRALSFCRVVIDRLRVTFGGAAPAAERSGTWPPPADRMIAEMRSCEATATRRTLARLPREITYSALHGRLADSWRARRYILLRLLSDPRDAVVLGLDRRFAVLYALAGPFLAIRRRVRRRAGRDLSRPE